MNSTRLDRQKATATRMGKAFLKRLDAGEMIDRSHPRPREFKSIKVKVAVKKGRVTHA